MLVVVAVVVVGVVGVGVVGGVCDVREWGGGRGGAVAAENRWGSCFCFKGTATTEIYTLSRHGALPIWR